MRFETKACHWNALLACAAKNDSRYYLNGIYVDQPNNRLVSTDGHSLIEIVMLDGDSSFSESHEAFIMTATKKAPRGGWVAVDTVESSVVFYKKSGVIASKEFLDIIDGSFPHVNSVIPRDDLIDSFDSVCFNPELFARITREYSQTQPRVILKRSAHVSGGPIVAIMPGLPEVTLIVMPCRPAQ